MPSVGTTATYQCIDGYMTHNTTTRTCNDLMTWNGSEPTCVEVECDNTIAVPNGFQTTNLSRYGLGDIFQFDCDAGYYPDGVAELVCQSTGIWNPTLPICQPVDCDDTVAIDHALVEYINGTTYQSLAYVQCEPGFNIFGSSVLTCNETGLWEPDLPKCIVISKHLC